MDLGEWIYIVFLSVAIVNGLFSSAKKKKEKNRPEILGQPNKDIVVDKRRTSKKRSSEELVSSIPQHKTVKAEIPKNPLATSTTSPHLNEESHLFNQRIYQPQKTTITNNDPLLTENTFNDINELKRAIICSEILNRKY